MSIAASLVLQEPLASDALDFEHDSGSDLLANSMESEYGSASDDYFSGEEDEHDGEGAEIDSEPHDEELSPRAGARPDCAHTAHTETECMRLLREKIMTVQRSTELPPAEKARRIQLLMTNKWPAGHCPASYDRGEGYDSSQVTYEGTQVSEEELETSYHPSGEYGCSHYQRGAKLRAECCGKFYTCRFCHDNVESHSMNRYETKTIMCMKCKHIQLFGEKCTNCDVQIARYHCSICRFFDDDPTKDIYHCPHCNICRIGKGLGIDYFHCSKCNACMSVTLKNHRCIERTLESNCPICHEMMFSSTTPVIFMPCGHCMHDSCYQAYSYTNYICPICSKSLGDMSNYFSRLDDFMDSQIMPENYKESTSSILCNDCEEKSVVPFHFLYHKCKSCNSYNTRVLDTLHR